MKIAVIGGNGQLGSDVVGAFREDGHAVVSLTHAQVEISNPASIRAAFAQHPADLVVNTAAMHHVERCEAEPEAAYRINALGAKNVAEATLAVGAALLHISTDYVFDGRKGAPYEEADVPCPVNVYGNTKLSGEHFVRTINPRHFVLRTSGLYGSQPCRAKGGLNFVDLMLRSGRERGRVRVVDTESVSPTSTRELARQVVRMCRSQDFGLYHATAEGSCSWYEFAKEIFTIAEMNVVVDVASSYEFPSKTRRPVCSVLENRGLKSKGLNILGPWRAGLTEYLSSVCGRIEVPVHR